MRRETSPQHPGRISLPFARASALSASATLGSLFRAKPQAPPIYGRTWSGAKPSASTLQKFVMTAKLGFSPSFPIICRMKSGRAPEGPAPRPRWKDNIALLTWDSDNSLASGAGGLREDCWSCGGYGNFDLNALSVLSLSGARPFPTRRSIALLGIPF